MTPKICLVVAVVSAGLLVQVSTAAILTVGSPNGVLSVDSANAGTRTPRPELGPDVFQWTGAMTRLNLGWDLSWDLTIDNDPSVSGVASFTNTMPGTANFTLNISSTSTVAIGSPLVNGASSITVLDTAADGATMSALTGGSIYDAVIGATSIQSLFSDPFSLVAPASQTNATFQNWGPFTSGTGIGIGQSFGINHFFSLTSGDQATINSSFFINIPTPGGAVVLSVIGLSIVSRRRRN